ncbi:guanine nucleotide exchange factor synembryn [Colletotrichum graminicola M1.001]|uniref:Guanine nucleotide exchange factor synembryn n=1 Tax=Colletotrichum graminicola (strain M1.001 / M2 / FGSC 10212) TaxID=645133 RepID=E3QAC2_COLGM|nr:guanine nucleotide exchange factor synembryn [Colletotrichum graminicola M1.001]EFQ27810.1 guanine nucleotide exchange factor synembryn [Colletotrichum graminicola M1.001]
MASKLKRMLSAKDRRVNRQPSSPSLPRLLQAFSLNSKPLPARQIMSQPPAMQANLTGPAKLDAVKSLMDKLGEDLKEPVLLPRQRDAALEELKVYGRDPTNADPIFTQEGIEILAKHAFTSPSNSTARAALRVLANSMLLNPTARQTFVRLGYEDLACKRLRNDSFDDEFLVSRVIFLTTYGTNIDLLALIQKHRLAEIIIGNLSKHAKLLTDREPKAPIDPMEDMALNETLKLLFNVSHYCPSEVDAFTGCIPHIIALLWKHDVPSDNPLNPPFNALVNALLELKLEDKDIQAFIYPKSELNMLAERLIEILDPALKTYPDNELEQLVTPLVGVLRRVYDGAPEEVKKYVRKTLLPTEEDRKEVLGRGSSLTSRLLRNSTNPLTPHLRDAISRLLFDMSDQDASKFVQNVGYGFASGFLFQNNIPVPASVSEVSSTGEAQMPVNPITGQFVESEKHVDVPKMTEDEKIREAERLFVLFERLRKTGVVDIQNPVEMAARSGQLHDFGDKRVEEVDE